MKKTLRFLFIAVLIAFPTFSAMLAPGMFDSHDGNLHIGRIWQMSEALKAGQIPGRWASALFAGLGLPIFVVNFQLPYYFGAFLYWLGFSLAASLKIQLILAAVFSAFFIFLLLHRLFDSVSAFIGTFLYTWAPYRFADNYTRAAIGEAWIFVFLPPFFYLMLFRQKGLTNYLYGSLIFALIVLSHPAVIIFLLPYLLIFAVFQSFLSKSLNSLKFLIAAVSGGFLLSAFSWLPYLCENKFLPAGIGSDSVYKTQFISLFQLFHIPKANVNMLSVFQFGVVNTAFFFAVVIWIVIKVIFHRKYPLKNMRLIIFMILTVFASLFLITPQAKFIWDRIQVLQVIMFPWRLLILSVFAVSIIGANVIHLFSKTLLRLLVGSVFVVFIVLCNYSYLSPGKFEVRSGEFYKKAVFLDAYLPKLISVRNNLGKFASPQLEVIAGQAEIGNPKIRSGRISFTLNAQSGISKVKIGQLYFPGWRVKVDDKEVVIDQNLSPYNGLITFPVGQGFHHVEARFSETPIRLFADFVSLGSFILLAVLLIYSASSRFA